MKWPLNRASVKEENYDGNGEKNGSGSSSPIYDRGLNWERRLHVYSPVSAIALPIMRARFLTAVGCAIQCLALSRLLHDHDYRFTLPCRSCTYFRQVGCHSPGIFAQSAASEWTACKRELQFIQLARLGSFIWKNFGNSAAASLILAATRKRDARFSCY